MSDVIERFFRYVQIDTQSDETTGTHPSTAKQHDMASLLAKELEEYGASEVCYDREYGYVYAKLPANIANASKLKLGFIAHMDTAPDMSGANVKPRIVADYDGGDIILNEEQRIVLSPKEFPELSGYKGKSLIVTDGTTLLGADDKAGVAEIMSMVRFFKEHPEEKHGELRIAFTPDEEIGEGADHFNLVQFDADEAYTVDGGALGEVEYENFNAASLTVEINGCQVHPGSAKDKMVNSQLLAMEYNALLPEDEIPARTEGYQGFYHLTSMEGSVDYTRLHYIIRDHDRAKFEQKKAWATECAEKMNCKYGKNYVKVSVEDSYYNMREIMENHMDMIERVQSVMEELGICFETVPIRGGTDGARLSFEGLPCPNLCTGGMNYHGRYEYACVDEMEQMTEVLVRLAKKI